MISIINISDSEDAERATLIVERIAVVQCYNPRSFYRFVCESQFKCSHYGGNRPEQID